MPPCGSDGLTMYCSTISEQMREYKKTAAANCFTAAADVCRNYFPRWLT
jgi:hypothetical protein